MSIFKIIHNFSDFFLHIFDFIFPKSEKVQMLESLTLTDWHDLLREGIHENVYFSFSYESKDVRQAIWEIKYKRNSTLRERMVAVMCESFMDEIGNKMIFENFHNPILTFIPQSKKRKGERGYNQSQDLADEMAKKFSLKTEDFLIKIRDTENQTKLGRTNRLINMKNSFAVSKRNDAKENICGKNIIVVDDVVTTGATLNEVRKVLLRAGAKKVVCVALAH